LLIRFSDFYVLGIDLFIFMLCQIGFESFGQFTACEHDAPPTALTFKPDIRAEASHCPFVGTAGMLFAKAQVIVEVEVGEHWEFGELE